MSILIGLEAKMYILDPAGLTDPATDVWPATGYPAAFTYPTDFTELTAATDVTVNLSRAEADISSRGAQGWRQKKGTLKEGSLEFTMNWDPADTSFVSVFNAWDQGTNLLILAIDQSAATDGFQGLYADMAVLNFEKSEALESAQQVNVSLSVSDISRIVPEFVKYTAP